MADDLIQAIVDRITEPGKQFEPTTGAIKGMELLIGAEQVLALRRIADSLEILEKITEPEER